MHRISLNWLFYLCYLFSMLAPCTNFAVNVKILSPHSASLHSHLWSVFISILYTRNVYLSHYSDVPCQQNNLLPNTFQTFNFLRLINKYFLSRDLLNKLARLKFNFTVSMRVPNFHFYI